MLFVFFTHCVFIMASNVLTNAKHLRTYARTDIVSKANGLDGLINLEGRCATAAIKEIKMRRKKERRKKKKKKIRCKSMEHLKSP